MKIVHALLLTSSLCISSYAMADERDDINQVLKEIHYIKEVATQLNKKNKHCKAKVCFNYHALLQQLRAMEVGIKEYLNLRIQSVSTQPPQPVTMPLYKVRKN